MVRYAELSMRSSNMFYRNITLNGFVSTRRVLFRRHCSLKRPAVRHAAPVTALLPQPFASALDFVAITAAAGALCLSALPLLTGKAAKENADRPFNSDTEEEDFTFALAGGVSLLPYTNWTAWILRAFSEERDAALYYATAAAYALPWLTHDLRLDSFTIFMLLLGATQVQVERLATTQAVELRVPGISRLAQSFSGTVAMPVRDVASAARRRQAAASNDGSETEDDSTGDFDKRQLQEFDEILKSRQPPKDKQP